MATELRTDIHLLPLYLKFAADQFQKNNAAEGLRFFDCIRSIPRSYEHKVYKQLWKVHDQQSKVPTTHKEDREYGRKAFHGFGGLSSTAQEKVRAIELYLQRVDRAELDRREAKVHECLWELNGRPSVDLEYGKHAFNGLHGRSAAFEQKIKSITTYAERSRLSTLCSDTLEMHLIQREDGDCETVTVNPLFKKILITKFTRSERNLEKLSENFRKKFVVGSAPITFAYEVSQIFPSTYTIFGDKKFNLCVYGNHFIWRSFDLTTKKVSWVSVSDADLRIIQSFGLMTDTERASVALDYYVRAGFTASKVNWVSLHKITHECALDSSQNVDRDNWAVTLVSYGSSAPDLRPDDFAKLGIDIQKFGIKSIPLDPGFGHAIIVYEGIDKGAYFIRRAHLTTHGAEDGYAKVYDEDFFLNKEHLRNKSPTWVSPRHFVEKMREVIRLDASSDLKIIFNRTGNPVLSPSKLTPNQFLVSLADFNDYAIDSLEDLGDMATFFLFRETTKKRQRQRKAERQISHFERDMRYMHIYHVADINGKNCLTWTQGPLWHAGIELPKMDEFINSPDAYIRWISETQQVKRRDF